ncbi:MAG: adenylyl-sulfate kinase [Actinobacteria bacterium]|jgi:bifunctional enzyme CysN/CysC|nr:adenylyl-sulfate kinase [Actinomycetota bacterium]
MTIWLTGLPASGKSTLAGRVGDEAVRKGKAAYVLDGDQLRQGLCSDLGFSTKDRAENIRRTAEVACIIAGGGAVCIVSLISPLADARARARDLHRKSGILFYEVYLSAPPDICEKRDPKGLYRRYRQGLLTALTGMDSPYEPPTDADLVLPTHRLSIEESVRQIMELVKLRPV